MAWQSISRTSFDVVSSQSNVWNVTVFFLCAGRITVLGFVYVNDVRCSGCSRCFGRLGGWRGSGIVVGVMGVP